MILIATNLNRREEQELFQAVYDHLRLLDKKAAPKRVAATENLLLKLRTSRRVNNG